jgi:hypothetical protein
LSLQFDQNTFEHDYIVQILSQFKGEIKNAIKLDAQGLPSEGFSLNDSTPRIIDRYATELTAFMNGKIVQAMENET